MSGGGNREQSQATGTVARAIEETRRRSWLGGFLKRLVREKPLGTVGGIIVLILLLTGIFADVLAPYGYKEVHLADRMSPPGVGGYLLGTDGVGRDMLSRIIYGARISMIVGLAAASISAMVATVLIGLPSGYLGGKFDIVVQRFVDAWIVFPGLVIYLISMIVGPSISDEPHWAGPAADNPRLRHRWRHWWFQAYEKRRYCHQREYVC